MIFKQIKQEGLRLRKNYHPAIVEDLERLAQDEYAIRVIVTPYAIKENECGCRSDGLKYTLYSSINGKKSMLSLAHQISHFEVGHFKRTTHCKIRT
ncbi:hypothetical protein V202x_41790 [Gimesia aquarii]|uniref:Uncharacterized protein n=1 Tax=Gimesia aquarii TaxID=2527964 RepID=A0A517WZT3_9PLAN|nr:hypothetical protein V202x_41790 [Gimesia aquarii]